MFLENLKLFAVMSNKDVRFQHLSNTFIMLWPQLGFEQNFDPHTLLSCAFQLWIFMSKIRLHVKHHRIS